MELKGLNLDNKYNSITGSWLKAKNIIVKPKPKPSIQNEPGFDYVLEIDNTIIGTIKTPNEQVFFSTNGVVSEIGIKRGNDDYSIIIRDSRFNFSVTHPIYGVFDYNHKKELIIVWTDNKESVFILNVDDLPFGVDDTTKGFENSEDFKLVQLFPDMNGCNIQLTRVSDTNGSLKTGIYFVVLMYGFADESFLTYQNVSNKIVITDDSISTIFSQYDGCESGESTTKSIQLNISNLDTRYTYFKIGLISQISGVVEAHETEKIYISSEIMTYSISSVSNLAPQSINKFLQQTASYIKAKSLAISNRELLLFNVEEQAKANYQNYANNIKIEWYRDEGISLDSVRGSYKDPVFIFNKTGFKAGEVYAFYVKLNHKKGYIYGIYHIPGREFLSGDTATLPGNDISGNKLDSEVKTFQVYDTSDHYSPANTVYKYKGEMSYWENRNEVYPTDFGTIAGEKVRHHKFPNLYALEETHKNPIYYASGEGTAIPSDEANCDIDFDGNNNIIITSITWNNLTGESRFGIFTDSELDIQDTKYISNFKQIVKINATIQISSTIITDQYIISFVHKDANGIILDTKYQTITCDNSSQLSGDLIFNLGLLDTIEINSNIPDTNEGSLSIDTSLNNITLFTNIENELTEGTKFSKPLGIIVSNIEIPDEIKDDIDSIEILYAERTVENMTILGQSIIYPYYSSDPNPYVYELDENCHMHPFDILALNLDTKPTHILNELIFDCDETSDAPPIALIDHKLLDMLSDLSVSKYDSFSTHLDRLRTITDYKVLPPHNIAAIPSTEYKEGSCNFNIDAPITSITNEDKVLTNLCVYKQDVYKNFQNQNLISTGVIIKVRNLTEDNKIPIFGGDTYINAHSFKRFSGKWSVLSIGTTVYYLPYGIKVMNVPVESYFNIGLRYYDELNLYSRYYPKSSFTDMVYSGTDGLENEELFLSEPDDGNNIKVFTNLQLVNRDYQQLNLYVKGAVTMPNANIVSEFPFRIARSNPQLQESVSLNWRTFLTANYYEMPRDKGEIWHGVAQGKALYILHEKSIYVAIVKDVISGINEDIYLRTGDMFDRPPEEKIPTEDGYIGNRSIFGVVLTKHGLITLDRLSGKIFWFKSIDNIVEIIEDNMDFFEDLLKLQFEDLLDVVNPIMVNELMYLAAMEGTAITYGSGYQYETMINKIDNPILGKGCLLYYDDRYNRMITTVKNVERYPVDHDLGDVVPDYYDGKILQFGVKSELPTAASSFSFFLWGSNYTFNFIDSVPSDPPMGGGVENEYDILITTPEGMAESMYNYITGVMDGLENYYVRRVREVIIIKSKVYNDGQDLYISWQNDGILEIQSRQDSKVVDKSKTLSFSLDFGFWVAEHDYLPTFAKYISRNKGMLSSIDVNTDFMKSALYNHNSKDDYSKFYRVYDATNDELTAVRDEESSYVDYVFSSKSDKDFLLKSIIFENIVEDKDKSFWDKHFTHIGIYNEQQCTGLIELTVQTIENTLEDGNLAYHRGEWRFNKFSDNLLEQNVDFFNKDGSFNTLLIADSEVSAIVDGNVYMVDGIESSADYITYNGVDYTINTQTFVGVSGVTSFTTHGSAVVKNFKNWFDKSNFIGKFVAIRLYYDNSDNYKATLIDLKVNVKTLV
jgi:hypothetical protein